MTRYVQYDLVIRARRAVTPDGEGARAVGVSYGGVQAVKPYDAPLTADREVELGDDVVLLPGLVDTHVHVNEPGRTEWEGFTTATRAAAAGGVTTIIDMPLNSIPPTTTVEALWEKRAAAKGSVYVDVGFWGGAVPGNLGELPGLREAGAYGYKCFLLHSGVDEFGHLTPGELAEVLPVLRDLDMPLLVHAEDAGAIDHAPAAGGRQYRDFLASRPRGAENLAIAQVIELARATGARVHILHLSSSDALPMIASARRDGVAVTAETCPHYLTFAAEEVPDGATQFKCCPPIREASNRELLWEGLRSGVVDCVVSDHSPCTPELKRLEDGDFGAAWGGIASLQLGLPAVWTQARARGFGLADVVRWMAVNPARLAGFWSTGRIEFGADADFVVFAPDEPIVVDAAGLHHRHPVTPYDGLRLTGAVRSTWLRGVEIDLAGEPRGRLIPDRGDR
jgi:allantoinase